MFSKTSAKISFRIMERIARKSGSMTTDLIVDHELTGVTPEMIDWWWDHIDSTERYKLWHPKDHKSFVWDVSPKNGHVGAIQTVIETIKLPTLLRIRWEDIKSIPISVEYEHKLAASVLDRNDKPISWLLHEYESSQNGTRLRTTFRLPEKVPQWFIKALRKHNIGEIGEFPNFLSKLYEDNKEIKNS